MIVSLWGLPGLWQPAKVKLQKRGELKIWQLFLLPQGRQGCPPPIIDWKVLGALCGSRLFLLTLAWRLC